MHEVRGLFLGKPGQPPALSPVGQQVFQRWFIKAGAQRPRYRYVTFQ